MLYFFIVYSLFFCALALNIEVTFLNEEFLIAVSMLMVFFLLLRSMRKLINFSFFYRAEQIYFLFLKLILLNIKLIDKMLKLINLEILRLSTLNVFQLYAFLSDFSLETVKSLKIFNLIFLKNFIFSFVFSLHLFKFVFLADIFTTKTIIDNNVLSQEFFIDTDKKIFSVQKLDSLSLLDALTLDELGLFYDEMNKDNFSIQKVVLDDDLISLTFALENINILNKP